MRAFNASEKGGYVYIMSNPTRTVFYIGVTADLIRRVGQHAEGSGGDFTSNYHCIDLVYYEVYTRIEDAIARETALKNWKRDWKLILIRQVNPTLKTIGFMDDEIIGPGNAADL